MMEFEGIEKKDVKKRQSLHGEIKEYKLSGEELAKVREETGWNRENFNKEIYVQRKQEGKTDREIMKEFNLYPKKLNELKHEWGLIGKKEAEFMEMKKQVELDTTKEKGRESLPNEIGELQLRIKELEEYEVQLSERNAYLETELTNLSDELERYKSTLAKERTEASNEYERLLKKNSELAEIVKDLKEEIEILKGGIKERDGDNDALHSLLEKQSHKLNQLTKAYDDLVQERNLLRSKLGQSDSEPCQSCEKYQEEITRLEEDKRYLQYWNERMKDELDEFKRDSVNYQRKYNSTALALKELIEVELFGVDGESDARD